MPPDDTETAPLSGSRDGTLPAPARHVKSVCVPPPHMDFRAGPVMGEDLVVNAGAWFPDSVMVRPGDLRPQVRAAASSRLPTPWTPW